MADTLLTGPVQVVWLTDVHVGSLYGICPLDFHRTNGELIDLNPLQELALEHWNAAWDRRRADGRPLVLILGGEMIDNNHHGTYELWTPNPREMRLAAVQLLKPRVAEARYTLGVLGTPAHSGQSGEHDEQVYQELGVMKTGPGLQLGSQVLRIEISGVMFNVAHHGPPPGGRPDLMGNSARSYAKGVCDAELKEHRTPSRVILRGHYHRKVLERYRDQTTGHIADIAIGPAWKWKDEFGWRVDSLNHISDVGMTVIGVDNGKVTDIDFDVVKTDQARTIVL